MISLSKELRNNDKAEISANKKIDASCVELFTLELPSNGSLILTRSGSKTISSMFAYLENGTKPWISYYYFSMF